MSGGGGGGGGQTSVTTASLPPELRPLATAYANKAMALGNTPYKYYEGQRYADMSGTKDLGIGMIQDRALYGDALQNTGYNYLGNMLTSGPQSATWNPYGGVSAGYNGMQVDSGSNPFANVHSTSNPYGYASAGVNDMRIGAGYNNATIDAGQNQFLGQNKYLNQNIDAALGDVARTYNQTVKPGQVGANVNSGSFGNSGLAEVQAMQENDLQKQMGGIASNMRMQDYQNQQQLAEAGLTRSLAAQQANSQLGEANLGRYMQAQLANLGTNENNLSRQMQTQQFNAGLGESQAARDMQAAQIRAQYGEEAANRFLQAQQMNLGTTEANLARQMQAQQFNSQMGQDWATRNDAMYQNYMGNNLNALGLANTYGNQQYQDAAQLLNAGQMQQDQYQQGLDFNYQQFQEKENNPYKQLAAMAGVFGSNLGSSSTTTTSGGGGK